MDDYTAYLEQAKALVSQIESGDIEKANESIDALTKLRETTLFQELGRMTRDLHNALNNLNIDSKLSGITESEMPEAKERLEYVIQLTEEAANKTLEIVEVALPRAEEMETRAGKLKEQWDRFQCRDMNVEEFRGLSKEIDVFLAWSVENATHVRSGLSDVMMAQGFQDITGQIIRRVISTVQEVEDNLVGLIKLTGQSSELQNNSTPDKTDDRKKAIEAEGPQVPGMNKGKGQVVSNQDEVDDLLSSLGF